MEYKKGTCVIGLDMVRGKIVDYENGYYIVAWDDSSLLDKIDEDFIENFILNKKVKS